MNKYFRIYTKNRVFNVYKNFNLEKDFENLCDEIISSNRYKFTEFMTNEGIPIRINANKIIAMEIGNHMFPERT